MSNPFTEEWLAERNQRVFGVAPTPAPKIVAAPVAKRRMNKWESQYSEVLGALKIDGKVFWYEFEPIRLRLANGAWYKPDFAVLTPRGLEFHEVKGHWREAARVRIKVAADRFPFPFIVVTKAKNGEWQHERIV